jgi:hypothetical protein
LDLQLFKRLKYRIFPWQAAALVGIVMALSIRGFAQFEHKLFSSNLLVEGKVHYGFIYAQHLEMELFNAHFPAYEFTIQQITYGKYQWERDYKYPLIGVTSWYSGLGDNPSLGQAFALMPFINFPLYRQQDFMAGFRLALGIGYLTNPFDRLDNYKNLAIGSHFNAAVNLMVEARYQLNYFLTLSAGISLQHFSNGSLKLPNYGLNIPLVNAGIALRPFKANQNIDDRFIAPTDPFEAIIYKTLEFNIGGLAGYKNMQAVFGQNYLVFHLYENTFFRIGKISKAGFGLDFSYDPSQISVLEKNGDTLENPLKIIRPGINGAYQLVMSRVGLIVNFGCYLGGAEKSNGPLYEKFSFQYNFSRNLYATVMLKVHWGRADYIGWGLGYTFNMKYGKKTIR